MTWLRRAEKDGVQPDAFIYSSLIQICSRAMTHQQVICVAVMLHYIIIHKQANRLKRVAIVSGNIFV